MWESRLLLARFPRRSWEEWEAGCWLSTLSTARHFHGSVTFRFFGVGVGASRRRWCVVSYCGPGDLLLRLFFNR